MMCIRFVFLAFAAAPLMLAPAGAAEPAPPVKTAAKEAKPASTPFNSDEPIDISADEADIRQAEHLVILSGNVVALQGDMRLEADKVSVFYAGENKASTQEQSDEAGLMGRIERLEAQGNVKVTRPDQVVRAQKAFYRMSDAQVVMSGKVTATHKKNVINSEKVIVDLKANTIRLAADKSDGRVKGLFVPESKTPPKNN